MADFSESTPFLADNDHSDNYDETEHHIAITAPARSHFKLPLKVLTILVSLLCISIFSLLIASYIFINGGPFERTERSQDAIRDLAICLCVNFILTAPTIFLQIPILINMSIHIAMSVVIFIFSAEILGDGWPSYNFCARWRGYPDNRPLPETRECQEARNVVRITMGVSAGIGIVIGLIILTTLLLRFVAVARTRFWERMKFRGLPSCLLSWEPTGFTVQFTFSVLKQETHVAKPINLSGVEGSQLIET